MDAGSVAILQRGCSALGLEFSTQQYRQLTEYLDLLVRWNKAYNLTAVRRPEDMVVRHLLDSLAIAAYLPAGRLIDVGTGAGLPGVPLAIAMPQHDCHLLDSNGT